MVAPTAGVKVPAEGINVPPVPEVLVHVPPACSPVINPYKSISTVLLTQIVVVASVPAFGCGFIFTVASLESLTQGAIPVKVEVKVEVVAPTAGIKVPAMASNVPPVPVRVQTPPDCSPVIKLYKLIRAVLVSQTVVTPSEPALGCKFIFTVAKLESLMHGAIPVKVEVKVEVVAPTAGIKVPTMASNVPPVPVRVQTPPDCSPVIKLYKSITAVLVSQTVVTPSEPA